MSFSLEILDTHWIDRTDNPRDLCLHGKVKVVIGSQIIDDGLTDDWTVSAGAYRMLQSLFEDHHQGNEEHLLPCCGHFMFVDKKNNQLVIAGCPNGIDWSVIHDHGKIKLITASQNETVIDFGEYKKVVLDFADKIEAVYQQSSPKFLENGFEIEFYKRFWDDWTMWRKQAVNL